MLKKAKKDFYHDIQMTAYTFYVATFGNDEGFNDWFYTWGFEASIREAEECMVEARQSYLWKKANRFKED